MHDSGDLTRRRASRSTYAALVLALALVIAMPGLVLAQSSAPGDDQMFTASDLCTIVDSRFWNPANFGGDTKPQPSTNYSFEIRGEATDFSGQGGSASGCGVPTTADAVLVNLLAIGPDGGGNFKAFASDVSAGDVSGTVINYNSLSPNVNLNNAVVVPLDASTADDVDITIRPQGHGAHIQVVVLGFYENVTDGFFTEAQSDARYSFKSHDHDVVEVSNTGHTATANATTTVVSTNYTITDECFFIFGETHNVLVRVNGAVFETTNINVDLAIAVGGTQQSQSAQENHTGAADTDDYVYSFALQDLLGLGSGTHTISFQVDNDDPSDSTAILDTVMTIEHLGWTCSLITLGDDADERGSYEDQATEEGPNDTHQSVPGDGGAVGEETS